jgi:hypothetical protein
MSYGQTPIAVQEIEARKIDNDIRIDGLLNEEDWSVAHPVTGFWTNFPADTTLAKGQTVVRMMFDKEFVYIEW